MRVGEIRENKAMSGLRIKGLGEEIATLANLPWDQSLENWPEDEVLTGMRGISRHVVRLIRSNPNKSNSEIFAVKETVPQFANREYTLLIEGETWKPYRTIASWYLWRAN